MDAMHRRAMQVGGKSYDSSTDPYWKEIVDGGGRYKCLCFGRGTKPRTRDCIEICQFAGDPDYERDGDWYALAGTQAKREEEKAMKTDHLNLAFLRDDNLGEDARPSISEQIDNISKDIDVAADRTKRAKVNEYMRGCEDTERILGRKDFEANCFWWAIGMLNMAGLGAIGYFFWFVLK